MTELTWVEISKSALSHNISQFRRVVRPGTILCPCVKANAYGHGLLSAASVFCEAGAQWLSVNALYEAEKLRAAGITCPVYILGYVSKSQLRRAIELDCRLAVYNKETLEALNRAAKDLGTSARVHLKIETGTNRQGIAPASLATFTQQAYTCGHIVVEGISTHFANIEDTTDHSYAECQFNTFIKAAAGLEEAGMRIPMKHCANSAATILFPETHLDMVRVGISAYGMWPSNETYVSYVKERKNDFSLRPAFTWKSRIAQVKTVPAGQYIGYGCTFKTSHETRLAVIPVGY
jgi:alanine racemase